MEHVYFIAGISLGLFIIGAAIWSGRPWVSDDPYDTEMQWQLHRDLKLWHKDDIT